VQKLSIVECSLLELNMQCDCVAVELLSCRSLVSRREKLVDVACGGGGGGGGALFANRNTQACAN